MKWIVQSPRDLEKTLVIYRYESNIITIFIEKIADRKDAYE